MDTLFLLSSKLHKKNWFNCFVFVWKTFFVYILKCSSFLNTYSNTQVLLNFGGKKICRYELFGRGQRKLIFSWKAFCKPLPYWKNKHYHIAFFIMSSHVQVLFMGSRLFKIIGLSSKFLQVIQVGFSFWNDLTICSSTSPLAYSAFSLCQFCTVKYISDQGKFLPQPSPQPSPHQHFKRPNYSFL